MDGIIAIAIDAYDVPNVEPNIENVVHASNQKPAIEKHTTIDNEYVIYYWDWLCWPVNFTAGQRTYQGPDEYFIEVLKDIRHSMICIFENDDIYKSIKSSDSRGTDEEFEEMLKFSGEICLFETDSPLHLDHELPFVSRSSLIAMLQTYIRITTEEVKPEYAYADLQNAGFLDGEIKALGFEHLLPKEEE